MCIVIFQRHFLKLKWKHSPRHDVTTKLLGSVFVCQGINRDYADVVGYGFLYWRNWIVKGKTVFTAFAMVKTRLRALAQGLAREFSPQGVHMVHTVIDGAIDGDRSHNQFFQTLLRLKGRMACCNWKQLYKLTGPFICNREVCGHMSWIDGHLKSRSKISGIIMDTTIDWDLRGSYFEACNCETACPCVWLQPPSEGNCKLLVAWHIDSGHLNGETLDDLNVALACFSPGHMKDGNWQAALYVDERASDEQFDAVTQIFAGKLGGHPAILMSFVTEVWGIKKVKIDYQKQGSKRRLFIPDIAQAEVDSIQGIKRGSDATIDNPPLCVVTSHPAVVAKSNIYEYYDYANAWKFTERNSYYSLFNYHP